MKKKVLLFFNQVYPKQKPTKFKSKQEQQKFQIEFKQLSTQEKINWVEYIIEEAWLLLQNKQPEQSQLNILQAVLKIQQYNPLVDNESNNLNFNQLNLDLLIEDSFVKSNYLRRSQKQKNLQIFQRVGLDRKTQREKIIQKKSKMKQQKRQTGFFSRLCGCFKFS